MPELSISTSARLTWLWAPDHAAAGRGFTFAWHESEHPAGRAGWPAGLPGMPGRA